MITNEFLPYEPSLWLKKLGFELGNDNVFFATYCQHIRDSKRISIMTMDEWETKDTSLWIALDPTPLYQQAEQFLWDKYKLFIVIERNRRFTYSPLVVNEQGNTNFLFIPESKWYDSPIETRKEGIIAAVKYLKDKK